MKGYMGKMLVVNLTERRIESQAIPEEWFEQYVGG
jgi:aldehyde:ferredoxin oxidoreductase